MRQLRARRRSALGGERDDRIESQTTFVLAELPAVGGIPLADRGIGTGELLAAEVARVALKERHAHVEITHEPLKSCVELRAAERCVLAQDAVLADARVEGAVAFGDDVLDEAHAKRRIHERPKPCAIALHILDEGVRDARALCPRHDRRGRLRCATGDDETHRKQRNRQAFLSARGLRAPSNQTRWGLQ